MSETFTSPEEIVEAIGEAPSTSPFSLDYYKQKAAEFQQLLNALDTTNNQHGLNGLGLQVPTLKLPMTLGAVPLALGAAAAAAIFAAAALITWGRDWIAGVNERLRDAQLLESVPEAQRGDVAKAIMQTEQAKALADASPLAAVAGMVKWLAIGAIAFFAYQAFQQYSGGSDAED
ncbi:MAG: hypothetical protein EBZ78_11180 [Verrucomicrobia bacterium]|nr:hypothetical protein [Verrucomicrobiota bacterium]